MRRRCSLAGRAASPMLVLLLCIAAAAFAGWWLLREPAPRLDPRQHVMRDPDAAGGATPFAAPAAPAAVASVAPDRAGAPASTDPESSSGASGSSTSQPASAAAEPARTLGARHGRLFSRATGQPIADAAIGVIVLSSDATGRSRLRIADVVPRAPSGSDGAFMVQSIAANEVLSVLAAGFAWTLFGPATLSRIDEPAATIFIERDARLHAIVRGAGGAPISGARVTLMSDPVMFADSAIAALAPLSHGYQFEAITDARGEAVLANLIASRTFHAVVELRDAPPDQTWLSHPIALKLAPGEEATREWQVAGGIAVRGRIVDESGQPLQDALIWVAREDGPFERAADGRVRFAVGGDSHVAAQQFADDSGRFEFAPLPAGSWWIGPAPWSRTSVGHRDHDLVPLATRLELLEGRVAEEIELRAVRGLFITGRAEDRRSAGVAARLLAVSLAAPLAAGAADGSAGGAPAEVVGYCDDEGWFRIGPLSAGDHELRVEPNDARQGRTRSAPIAAGTRDVRIAVPDAARLDVRCIAPDGAVVAARLAVVQQDGERIAWLDGRGRGGDHDDTIEGLPAGAYSIGATTDDGFAGVIDNVVLVEGEARSVRVALERGGSVELCYSEGPADRVTVSCQRGSVVIAVVELTKGARATTWLTPGSVRLCAMLGVATWGRDLELAAGEGVEVVIEP